MTLEFVESAVVFSKDRHFTGERAGCETRRSADASTTNSAGASALRAELLGETYSPALLMVAQAGRLNQP